MALSLCYTSMYALPLKYPLLLMRDLNDVPDTPLPDQTPTPNVDVVNAVAKFTAGLVIHNGAIDPVIVDGTYCSTEIVVVLVAAQVDAPTEYV